VQSLGAVAAADFLTSEQHALSKFEVYDGSSWYDLTRLRLRDQITDNLDTTLTHVTTDGSATITNSSTYSVHGGSCVKYVRTSGSANIYFTIGGGFGTAGTTFTFSAYIRYEDGSPVTRTSVYL
jgi:hypothetical protein